MLDPRVTLLKALSRLGSLTLENAASLLLGPWLSQGLWRAASGGRPRAVLSFDVDFRADVAALEDLLGELERRSLKASFALVGHWVRTEPGPHRAIAAAGHEILNHTLTHPDNEEIDPERHFHLLSGPELREQVLAAHRLIEDALGVRPSGFRAPHFGHQHTEAVYPVLVELGYRFSSSTLASRSPSFGWPHPAAGGRLWEIPVSVCPRHPFSAFDTWHYRRKRPNRHRPGDFLAQLAGLLRTARSLGLPLNFYFDPRDVVRDGEGRAALDLLAASGLAAGSYQDWLNELEAAPVGGSGSESTVKGPTGS